MARAATAPKTQPKQRRTSGWSPERRAHQAARIKLWAPWAKSTGPRTKAGKARSARNALKTSGPDCAMKRAMRAYGRYLVDLDCYIGLKQRPAQNELLKGPLYNLRRRLLKRGARITTALNAALLYAKLCKNLAFSASFPLKVNAPGIASTLATQAGDGAMQLKRANDNG